MEKQKLSYKKRRRQEQKKNENPSVLIVSGIAAIFFIVITAVYPLYITDEKYIALTGPKTFFFWTVTIIAASLILVTLFFRKNNFFIKDYYIENEPVRVLSVSEWAVLAFIALTFISAVAASFNRDVVIDGPNRMMVNEIVWRGYRQRYEGFISFLCYVMTFFIIARFYRPKRLHLILFAGSACLVSLIGILQFFGHDIFNLFPFEDMLQYRGLDYGPLSAFFRTTLGNVNIVSAYCSFAIVLFAALFAVSRSKWQYAYLGAGAMSFALSRTTGGSGDAHAVAIAGAMVILIPYWLADRVRLGKVLIALASWCVVFAGYSAYMSALKNRFEADPSSFTALDQGFISTYAPRSPVTFLVLAAVLIAAGLSLILLLKKWPERPMKIAGIVFLPAAFIIGISGVLILGSRFAPGNMIWEMREILHGRIADEFGSGRIWIWRHALSVLFDNPILGTGPDTFYYALGPEIQRASIEAFNVTFDKAHNIFLQIAVCMGIPALLAYLTYVVSLFVSAVKKAFERPLLLAFGAAALSYMIQSFFCVEVPITTPLVWIAFGVMAAEVWMGKIGAAGLSESDI